MEQLEPELAPIEDASMAGRGFTHYSASLAPTHASFPTFPISLQVFLSQALFTLLSNHEISVSPFTANLNPFHVQNPTEVRPAICIT